MGDPVWQRHVALEGCLNLRDVGGYPTQDGRQVRTGCLFRSSELAQLTDDDVAVLAELGVRVVVDLRGERERLDRPNRLPPEVTVIVRETASQRGQPTESLEDQIASGTLPVPDDDLMTGVYLRHLDEALVAVLRHILERALDAPERPLLFHCAAGKDRTGLAAAVVLGLLGVDEATIVADYELTEDHWAAPRLAALRDLVARHDADEDRVRRLLSPRTGPFRTALAHVHEEWGGFDGYAVGHLGVDPSLPGRLRAALLIEP